MYDRQTELALHASTASTASTTFAGAAPDSPSTTVTVANGAVSRQTLASWLPSKISPYQLGKVVAAFLDAASTAFGRATHYNTRDEQQTVELAAHRAMIELDRDLYTAFLTLPGITDRARQLGVRILLDTPTTASGAVETERREAERQLCLGILAGLPPQRMLAMFDSMRQKDGSGAIRRVNNSRTRKLILRTLLGSRRLELWSVKYRRKLRRALTHAWGQSTAGIVRSILAKDPAARTDKERRIVDRAVTRYARDARRAMECVGFVLGVRERLTLPLLRAFVAARSDIHAGKNLPVEVLEGIRGQYHGDIPSAEVLAMTSHNLTRGQRMAVQRKARAAGVEVAMDVRDYDPVRLYLYAFEMGLSREIAEALDARAETAARAFPIRCDTVGVLLDASYSMSGSDSQPLRPMATVLALRDVLQRVGRDHVTVVCGGARATDSDDDGGQDQLGTARLIRPRGATSLAAGLLELLDRAPGPDVIFVVSDGYDNRPAGRFAEIVGLVRAARISTPIHQISPVFAAESAGARALDRQRVPVTAVADPGALKLAMVRSMLDHDPLPALTALIAMIAPTTRPPVIGERDRAGRLSNPRHQPG